MNRFENGQNLPEKATAEEMELKDLPNAEVIVVLAHELRRNKKGKIVPDLESKMRAMGALEFLEEGKVGKIVIAGGITGKLSREKPIAAKIADYLIEHGAPADDIILESLSKNTKENLENVLDMLDQAKIKSAIIETSEYHLPRAKQLYENILKKRGLEIQTRFFSAEDALEKRSAHYKNLAETFRHPGRIKELGEYIRQQVLIKYDPEGKIATFVAHVIRK